MAIFVAIGIGILAVGISYLLMPKPKKAKPPEFTDLDAPVAEAGKPIPVVFGTVTVKGLNVLWYGDNSHVTKKVKA